MFHIYSKKSAHKQWMGPKTPNKQQGNTQYEKTLQVDVVEGYAQNNNYNSTHVEHNI